MVSIFSSHFFNWVKQLKNTDHEIFWFDVNDSGSVVKEIEFVHQFPKWRYRINFPGRYLIKDKFPKADMLVNLFNERDLQLVFSDLLEEIKPDVVHSFVMYWATAPLLEVLKNKPQIKWIYSSWGSDLYYYGKQQKENVEMVKTFPYIDYMFSDCYRDYELAKKYGFQGQFLGVFPGRGGYDFSLSDEYSLSPEKRNIILIKGYQGKHGRCIQVLKAILKARSLLSDYDIIVFGADEEVKNFVRSSGLNKWHNFEVFGKLSHEKILKLMGSSIVYIGNSLSDGMPNTLLESIIMGAFPVQSNPGGATAELIEDGKNGLLIEDPMDIENILLILKTVVSDRTFPLKKGIEYNLKYIKPKLEREKVSDQVKSKYLEVEKNL